MKINKSNIYYMLIAIVAIQDQLTTSPLFRSCYYGFFKYVLLVGILFCIFLEVGRVKPTRIQLLAAIALVFCGIYTATKTQSTSIIYITILSFFIKDMDIDRAIRIIYKTTLTFMCVNYIVFILMYFVNRGGLETMPMLDGGVRYLMFYDHPNNAAREYIFMIYLFAYVNYDKLKVRHWVFATVGAAAVYYFTKSDAVWTIPVIALVWAFSQRSSFEKAMQKFAQYGVVIMSALSFAMLWVASIPALNKFFLFLNVLASNRFTSNIKALDMYGITLLGQASKFGAEFEYMGKTYGWVYADNMYLYLLIHVGAIYLIILGILLWIGAKRLNRRELLPIVAMLIFGTFENRVLSIDVYFTVLLIINALVNRRGQDDLKYMLD